MEKTFKLRCETRWVQQKPAGQKCRVCGDCCYLNGPWDVEIAINPVGTTTSLGVAICNSCFFTVKLTNDNQS